MFIGWKNISLQPAPNAQPTSSSGWSRFGPKTGL